MKKIHVSHLNDGDTVTDFFAVTDCAKRTTRSNKPYLAVQLADATGTIVGRVWDNVEKLHPALTSGTIARITAKIENYQGELQMNIIDARKTTEKDAIDQSDFMPQTPHDIDLLLEQLLDIKNSVGDASIRTLLDCFFSHTETVQAFRMHPAAKKMHHAYIGGLLEHTLSVTKLCLQIAENYSYVNRDILIAGALLHDIGKLHEMAYDVATEYTVHGSLVGHLTIGSQMVDEAAKNSKEISKETLWQIQHLILSHHGHLEFGSPVIPATIEAFILHHADILDAQLFQAQNAIESDEEPDAPFTNYVRGLDRRIMKPTEKSTAKNAAGISPAPVNPTNTDTDDELTLPGEPPAQDSLL